MKEVEEEDDESAKKEVQIEVWGWEKKAQFEEEKVEMIEKRKKWEKKVGDFCQQVCVLWFWLQR